MKLKNLQQVFLIIGYIVVCSQISLAQQASDTSKLSVSGYATLNYQKYWWMTDTTRRAQIDLEEVSIEASYQVNDDIRVEAELEFEHGGTGSTMEFDRFEEFGEFEQEIEKGGEVKIEKLAVIMSLSKELNFRIGHIYVPVGLINSQNDLYYPTRYFTVRHSEVESQIIPSVWDENGIEVFGRIHDVNYQLLLVNGLDATGFSSANWIRRGHQGRFETVNAENLAVVGRVDYDISLDAVIGVSAYYGNSSDNRPKPDLTVPANVFIAEIHGSIATKDFKANGLLLYGTLQNSAEVSKVNRNLSNNLNVKRSPVASASLGCFIEAGYNIAPLLGLSTGRFLEGIDVYARVDYYDTMFKTDSTIFDNPRWERRVLSGGLNYRVNPMLIFKSQFSNRTLGLTSNNVENTLSLGMAIQL